MNLMDDDLDDLEQEVDEIMMNIFSDCEWTLVQRVIVTLPAMME